MSSLEQKHLLKAWIEDSRNIVFFGGAGVSTESDIPDFRSADGLYQQAGKYDYPPETILSASFFYEHPADFYHYYFDNLVYEKARPNAAHYALARLEDAGKLKAIITQNVDGLHQAAGSKTVWELHGSAARNYCLNCGLKYDLAYLIEQKPLPHCADCLAIIRPDIVLYEEALPYKVLRSAQKAIAKADLLIIGGTSLAVYPAASLIEKFKGRYKVLINKDATAYDRRCDLVFNESIGALLEDIID